MEEDVLLKKAKLDVYCAINLAVAVRFGYIKVNPEQFLEMYCILKTWQDKLGEKAPTPVKKLIEEIEVTASDIKDALLDYYNQYKSFEPHALDISQKPTNSIEQKENGDFYSMFIFFPPNNGIVS